MYGLTYSNSFRFGLVIILVFGTCHYNQAQEGSKSIKSEEYLAKRPADGPVGGATGSSGDSATKRPQPGNRNSGKTKPAGQLPTSFVYLVDKSFPEGPPPRNHEYVRMGVTVWRLSPSQCPIQNCPLPNPSANSSKGLVDTATRIEDNVPLNNGERVRIGLESLSHRGYVYVIDRELFADGTLGDAVLIFPTRKIESGKHLAHPGLQIHLPRASGCFCVKSRNTEKVLVADVVTVILSPEPLLADNQIGDDAIPLPSTLMGFLSRADKEKTFRALLQGGNGLAQTAKEQSAGAKGLFDSEPVLTRSDLPPQTFYQGMVPIGKAAVFNFSLRYGATGDKPSKN